MAERTSGCRNTSGRKERIMIACVTFETTKITDPARFYEATKIHIIHSAREDEKGSVYWDFYRRVCEILRSDRKDIDIRDVNIPRVSDFALMLRTVLGIIEKEREADPDCDIYVNISAGTSEYAAAAAIASMMERDVTLFSVGTAKYTVPPEKIKEYYYVEGKPVGLTDATKEPTKLASYHIQKPDERLVRGLRILSIRTKNKRPVKGPDMIYALQHNDLWYRDSHIEDSDPDNEQGKAVYYHRFFVEKWLKAGWVEKDDNKKRYALTPMGENVVETFFQPPVNEDPEKYLVERPRKKRG